MPCIYLPFPAKVLVVSPPVLALRTGRCFFVFFQFRIGNTCVVYGLESFDEHELGLLYVVERDGAVLEETVGHLAVYNLVYKRRYALFRICRERA